MESQLRSSFIPKKSISSTPSHKQGSDPMGLPFLLTFIAFGIVFVLTVGVFLYQQFLIRSIEHKGVLLEEARSAIEPALIEELTRLDTRINAADALIGKHIALSRLFEFLENNTIQDVQFTSFQFALSGDGGANMTLVGIAKSFNAVALQSDIFGRSRLISSPIFSGLNVNEEKNVTFSVSAFVSPDLLSYRSIAESRLLESLPESDVLLEGEEREGEEVSN